MRQVIFLILVLLLLIITGCSKDCPECNCPTCPRENDTDIDPPVIEAIISPQDTIRVNDNVSLSCIAVSDTDIVSYSWNLSPSSGPGENYYFPPLGTPEGFWTPSGTRPSLFVQTHAGQSVSTIYAKRGCYTATVQIQDADSSVCRGGTILRVEPLSPDVSANPIELMPGIEDTIAGTEFELMRMGLVADEGILATSYADAFNILHSFAYYDGFDTTGSQYAYLWLETGKELRIAGGAIEHYEPAEITANFDITGTLHLWNPSHDDFVEFSVYVMLESETGAVNKYYIMRQTIDGASGSQAYNFDSDRNEILIHTYVEGFRIYFVWFGIEAALHTSRGSGAAICFDRNDGFVNLNYMIAVFAK